MDSNASLLGLEEEGRRSRLVIHLEFSSCSLNEINSFPFVPFMKTR